MLLLFIIERNISSIQVVSIGNCFIYSVGDVNRHNFVQVGFLANQNGDTLNHVNYSNPTDSTCYADIVTDLGGAIPALGLGTRVYLQDWTQRVRITNTDNAALAITVYYIKCIRDCSESPLNAAGDFNNQVTLFPNYTAGNYFYSYDATKRRGASRPVEGAFPQYGFKKNFKIYGTKSQVLMSGESLYVQQKLHEFQKMIYQRYYDPDITCPSGTKYMIIRYYATGNLHSSAAQVSGTNKSGAPGGRLAVHNVLSGKFWVPPSLPQSKTYVFDDSTDRYLETSYTNMKINTEVAEQAVQA